MTFGYIAALEMVVRPAAEPASQEATAFLASESDSDHETARR
jgi:hypothetical protein